MTSSRIAPTAPQNKPDSIAGTVDLPSGAGGRVQRVNGDLRERVGLLGQRVGRHRQPGQDRAAGERSCRGYQVDLRRGAQIDDNRRPIRGRNRSAATAANSRSMPTRSGASTSMSIGTSRYVNTRHDQSWPAFRAIADTAVCSCSAAPR